MIFDVHSHEIVVIRNFGQFEVVDLSAKWRYL